MEIHYTKEQLPELPHLIDLFEHSEYFPIKDKSDTARIQRMFDKADIVVTAWHKDLLVGISRSICDFEYCCYLSDLCVRNDYKSIGIGKRLVEITKGIAGDACKLILDSSENAMTFYTKIGMKPINSAFVIPRKY